MTLILGRKRGMTQYFEEDGTVVPCTVVEAGPCVVTQIRNQERDGYHALQLGYEDVPDRRVTKPLRGHAAKAGTAPKRFLRESRLEKPAEQAVGDVLRCDIFKVGQVVDVIGTAKGRGFAGTIRRHSFQRGPKTHGSMNYRQPGSIGASAHPSRVFKGKRMGGHMGADRRTAKNIKIVRIDEERNLLFLRGSIPGPTGGFLQIQSAKTAGRVKVRTPQKQAGKKK